MNTAAELYNAVRKGQLAKIKRLIGEEVDLNVKFGKVYDSLFYSIIIMSGLECQVW